MKRVTFTNFFLMAAMVALCVVVSSCSKDDGDNSDDNKELVENAIVGTWKYDLELLQSIQIKINADHTFQATQDSWATTNDKGNWEILSVKKVNTGSEPQYQFKIKIGGYTYDGIWEPDRPYLLWIYDGDDDGGDDDITGAFTKKV
jgi:hypothetical protein